MAISEFVWFPRAHGLIAFVVPLLLYVRFSSALLEEMAIEFNRNARVRLFYSWQSDLPNSINRP